MGSPGARVDLGAMVRMTFWCFYELTGGAIQEDIVSFKVKLPEGHTLLCIAWSVTILQ
mgnify:CR=1 FL=1